MSKQQVKKITVYVQSCGSGLSFADQVLGRAADCHVSRHVQNPHAWCSLVEVHQVSILTVRPVVFISWWVSFARAVQQGTATLLHHQGVDMHHDVLRRNCSSREDKKKQQKKTFSCIRLSKFVHKSTRSSLLLTCDMQTFGSDQCSDSRVVHFTLDPWLHLVIGGEGQGGQ